MKSIDVPKIHAELTKFTRERDWDQFHSVKNLAMALSVESAELVEVFQWLTEKESSEVAQNPKLKAKVQEEIADVFNYLLLIASKCDVDIEEAVLAKIKKNSEKYPVEKAKGISKKYDEL